MLGTNPIAKARGAEDGFLVHSIFYTIQGEGPFAGMPAIFLRLGGCNLRCFWCDTEFTRDTYEVDAYNLAKSLAELSDRHHCSLIVITGGEPMLQPLRKLIMSELLTHCRFQIETAGTVWPPLGLPTGPGVRDFITIVCSPKTANVDMNVRALAHGIYWKYILREGDPFDLDDGLPTASTQLKDRKLRIFRPVGGMASLGTLYRDRIFVQACDEGDPARNLVNQKYAAAVAMKYGYRLSIQIHKIVGLS